MELPQPKGILLDIEGTTSSIEFVYKVMFPYARERLDAFFVSKLSTVTDDKALQNAIDAVARDAGFDSIETFFQGLSPPDRPQHIADHLRREMDNDSKATGLKAVQGLIWRDGFESGKLKSHLYDDVYPALLRWSRRAIDLRIYSSGSSIAQQLFFGHTELGDLRSFFKGFYDTTLGNKRSSISYQSIAKEFSLDSPSIVFFSDHPDELSAAKEAGMQTVAVIRSGNSPLPANYEGMTVNNFNGLW